MPRSSPVPQVVSQRKPAPKRSPRALLVGLAAAALLALGFIQWLRSGVDVPSQAATPPPALALPVAPKPELALPQLVTTVVPAPAPAPPGTEQASVAASRPPAPAPAGSRRARVSEAHPAPARRVPPLGSVPAAASMPSVVSASPSTASAPAPAAPAPAAVSPLPSGRSEKIEELIQRRR